MMTTAKRPPAKRRPRPLAEVKAQREWTFAEFARVLGRSYSYIHERATPTGDHGEGVICLPVGDVPYITDQFSSNLKPRRLVLACDYEAVEKARQGSAAR